MSRHSRTKRLVAALLLLAGSTPAALAQCTQYSFIEVWVDPYNGVDNLPNRVANDPRYPFRTITGAMSWAEINRGQGEALVRALPGIYSPNTNQEFFPLVMLPHVHLQGAGAKETVLRYTGMSGTRSVLWPAVGGIQRRINTSILVDFTSALQRSDEFTSSIDGFTFQGADVQVYAETELKDIAGRVSNCVFDMRHNATYPDDNATITVPGPYFGSLSGSVYDFTNKKYPELQLSLLSNTFVQSWRYGTNAQSQPLTEVSRAECVAICDTNEPVPRPGFGDVNTVIRGVADLNIQNNLIRSVASATRTALLGVDLSDVTVQGGARSNAFRGTEFGGSNGTFSSQIVGMPPLPRINLDAAANDPGFFGEMITQKYTGENDLDRDFRVLPGSSVIDTGVNPVVSLCNTTITAANGTAHSDARPQDGWIANVFDFDGEVHGNPRIADDTIDIGFDETDLYASAGSYGNDTKSHDNPWIGHFSIEAGRQTRSLIYQTSGLYLMSGTIRDFPVPPDPPTGYVPAAWTNMPGTLAAPLNLGQPNFFSWIDLADPSLFTVNLFVVGLGTWTNPESMVTHTYGETRPTQADGGSGVGTWFNTQVHKLDPATLEWSSSNLQSEYL